MILSLKNRLTRECVIIVLDRSVNLYVFHLNRSCEKVFELLKCFVALSELFLEKKLQLTLLLQG